MRPALRAVIAGVGLLASLVACQRTPDSASPAPLALPALGARAEALDQLQLLGAGGKVLWTLRKRDGGWHVVERTDWPAANEQVGQLLLALIQLHLADPRTDDPARYPRIGVEDVAAPEAQGVELRLGRGASLQRLLVGHAGTPDGDFVRIDGGKRSWLTDKTLEIARDPAQWLARDLIDRPLARIERVEVRLGDGATFRLLHDGDRFRLEGAHSVSSRAEALAGGLDQLKLDDVAGDDATIPAERTIRFVGVDGVDVDVALWRQEGQVWARLQASVDESRARAWAARSPDDAARGLAAVRAQVAGWQQRFSGRRFRLVPLQATSLMLGRRQLVEDTQ